MFAPTKQGQAHLGPHHRAASEPAREISPLEGARLTEAISLAGAQDKFLEAPPV